MVCLVPSLHWFLDSKSFIIGHTCLSVLRSFCVLTILSPVFFLCSLYGTPVSRLLALRLTSCISFLFSISTSTSRRFPHPPSSPLKLPFWLSWTSTDPFFFGFSKLFWKTSSYRMKATSPLWGEIKFLWRFLFSVISISTWFLFLVLFVSFITEASLDHLMILHWFLVFWVKK